MRDDTPAGRHYYRAMNVISSIAYAVRSALHGVEAGAPRFGRAAGELATTMHRQPRHDCILCRHGLSSASLHYAAVLSWKFAGRYRTSRRDASTRLTSEMGHAIYTSREGGLAAITRGGISPSAIIIISPRRPERRLLSGAGATRFSAVALFIVAPLFSLLKQRLITYGFRPPPFSRLAVRRGHFQSCHGEINDVLIITTHEIALAMAEYHTSCHAARARIRCYHQNGRPRRRTRERSA